MLLERKRNLQWSLQVSFQTAHLKRELCPLRISMCVSTSISCLIFSEQAVRSLIHSILFVPRKNKLFQCWKSQSLHLHRGNSTLYYARVWQSGGKHVYTILRGASSKLMEKLAPFEKFHKVTKIPEDWILHLAGKHAALYCLFLYSRLQIGWQKIFQVEIISQTFSTNHNSVHEIFE